MAGRVSGKVVFGPQRRCLGCVRSRGEFRQHHVPAFVIVLALLLHLGARVPSALPNLDVLGESGKAPWTQNRARTSRLQTA
jgi:hypothetical protein